jgi:hypothetical protein
MNVSRNAEYVTHLDWMVSFSSNCDSLDEGIAIRRNLGCFQLPCISSRVSDGSSRTTEITWDSDCYSAGTETMLRLFEWNRS